MLHYNRNPSQKLGFMLCALTKGVEIEEVTGALRLCYNHNIEKGFVMDKIYLVWRYDWEGSNVLGAYSTLEKAKAALQAAKLEDKHDDYGIEVYNLDEQDYGDNCEV